jgi:hypothetical protein
LENRAAKKYEMMSRKGISILCSGLRKKANFEKQIKDFRSCQYFIVQQRKTVGEK